MRTLYYRIASSYNKRVHFPTALLVLTLPSLHSGFALSSVNGLRSNDKTLVVINVWTVFRAQTPNVLHDY